MFNKILFLCILLAVGINACSTPSRVVVEPMDESEVYSVADISADHS